MLHTYPKKYKFKKILIDRSVGPCIFKEIQRDVVYFLLLCIFQENSKKSSWVGDTFITCGWKIKKIPIFVDAGYDIGMVGDMQ